MPRRKKITAPSFNPSTDRSNRALQAWQILISCAANRQTITYADLGRTMFENRGAGVLSQTLHRLFLYCEQHNLPVLPTLVVQTRGGRPGPGYPLPKGVSIDEERERVFELNWFSYLPPSQDNL